MKDIHELFDKYDLDLASSYIAGSADEAAGIAREIGYPVVLKIESRDILHKTDIGVVKLDLTDDGSVKKAFSDIMRSVSKKRPDARIIGISVQKMLKEGTEIIIGFNRDRIFGPVLMLGLGGIFTEIIKDIVFRVLPIDRSDAAEMVKGLKNSDIILKGYRGTEGVPMDLLTDAIYKISQLAMDLAGDIYSFDINPLMIWSGGHKIVDFKYKRSKEKQKLLPADPDTRHMEKFFEAGSVAIVGASGNSMKLGNYILGSIKDQRYKGKLFPINPNADEIMGIKAYPKLADVPEDLDLVVVTIPLGGVPALLEDCSAKGLHNMVIVSSGGKEVGNKQLEDEIKQKAKKLDVRIIGCNCIGVMNGRSGFDTFFYPEHKVIKPGGGNISMLAQSGTVGVSFLEKIKKYGINKFVSYGNRMDVDEGDLIEYLLRDDDTKVIVIYIESLENGSKFYRAAKKASTEKPIIVFKAGRSQQSSDLSKSHTGFLSETYSLSLSVFNQANMISVDSLEALVASAKMLSRFKRVRGNRVGIITNGAGAVIQAMDLIEQDKKLRLAEISGGFRKRLLDKLPGYALVEKIIDLTGASSDADYETAIRECYDNEEIDIIMIWMMIQNPFISEDFYLIFRDYIKDIKKPLVLGAAGEDYTREIGERIEVLGIPVFYTVDDWVAAAKAISID